MTARELIEILQSDNGIWLDLKIKDCFGGDLNEVVLKADGVFLYNE